MYANFYIRKLGVEIYLGSNLLIFRRFYGLKKLMIIEKNEYYALFKSTFSLN